MAKEICADCEKVFDGGPKVFLCEDCRKRRLRESAKARNLSKLGRDAHSKQRAGRKERT